ncbi:hypothetical protein BJV78DRAFT_837142 [Lactifluus subvellereus]|nr:hypothetical protein BJV78DRAFT_837142 [Lactifluus subvellereus]
MPNFYPFPANTAPLVTELLDPKPRRRLRSDTPLSEPKSRRHPFPSVRLSIYRSVTHLRPRIPGDSCRHANPHSFLSRSSLSATFLHSDMHLPNSTSTASAVDIFHSSAIPGDMCPARVVSLSLCSSSRGDRLNKCSFPPSDLRFSPMAVRFRFVYVSQEARSD